MNSLEGYQFGALLSHLFMTHADAANYFGVNPRTVRRWIGGQSIVPQDVVEDIYKLVAFRDELLDELNERFDAPEELGQELTPAVWIDSLEVFQMLMKDETNKPLPAHYFKPYQSALAQIIADGVIPVIEANTIGD